jgi:outer membrane protein TolC
MYGVAIANTMPQFMVTANVGGMASSPEWMFSGGGTFFSLTGNITQLIFDGGTLRAKSRAAEQVLAQVGAQYRGTVIAALQNVADTLHAIRTDANALRAADASVRASQAVLNLTRKQYRLGYVTYQNLLAAQQSYQLAVVSRAQAQSARLGDTAALYLALGGGWWNRKDEKTSSGISNAPTVTVAQGAKIQ